MIYWATGFSKRIENFTESRTLKLVRIFDNSYGIKTLVYEKKRNEKKNKKIENENTHENLW